MLRTYDAAPLKKRGREERECEGWGRSWPQSVEPRTITAVEPRTSGETDHTEYFKYYFSSSIKKKKNLQKRSLRCAFFERTGYSAVV